MIKNYANLDFLKKKISIYFLSDVEFGNSSRKIAVRFMGCKLQILSMANTKKEVISRVEKDANFHVQVCVQVHID